MVEINVLISNGTCYKSASEKSYIDYIPCGNAASGQHYPCCSKGDMCMSSNACFNPGCTDENYKADACPNKGIYDNQEWVGLTNCKSEQGKRGQDVPWIGCEEDIEEPSLNYGNQSCHCTPDRADWSIPFMDGQNLTRHANLPRSSGGTINFADGYTPTAVTNPTTQPSKSNDGAVTGTATSTATPDATSGNPAAATAQSGGPESFHGRAGRHRCRSRPGRVHPHRAKKEPGYQGLRPSPAGANGARTDGNNYDDKASPNPIANANAPAHHHSGDNNGHAHGFFKAELPADSPSTIVPSIETTPSPPITQHGQQQPRPIQYQAYDPDRDRWVPPLSAISERSNETMMASPNPYISPQSTGETVGAHGTQHGQRSGGMDPIYEMQG
ncbi:hypothetical protein PG997_012543 [Apiospora hydei]|uniref:Uncharacterized protein n=1 Tax=Apiospora hydei TaxID=1337664 RepID=A0ABR1V667_9PEZI